MPPCRLLAYPFRVFFLLTGAFACLGMLTWLGILDGHVTLPIDLPTTWWHGHEMLYGLIPAAIAGFLLTAMANWTGMPPPTGRMLLGLAVLWIAGRVVMASAALLPGIAVAIIDLSFLPVLAIIVLNTLWRAGNRRNLPLVAVLATFAIGNLLMHLAFLGVAPSLARTGELLGLNLAMVLLAVIGGRITPAFTANWLGRQGGDPAIVRRRPRFDLVALGLLVAVLVIDLFAAGSRVAAIVALLAGVVHAIRVLGWRGWHARADALTWILHVGYAWIPVALVLKGLAPITDTIGTSVWIHTLGVGAVGTTILAVMTRVSVAHTGRGLILRRGARLIYGLITAAALLRIAAAAGLGDIDSLNAAGLAWITAFALFLVVYTPVLYQPRVDNRPG